MGRERKSKCDYKQDLVCQFFHNMMNVIELIFHCLHANRWTNIYRFVGGSDFSQTNNSSINK